jgi:hypothetical protein
MTEFQLPVISANANLNEAFGTLHQNGASGLVVRSPNDTFHLVTLQQMTEMAANPAGRLEDIPGQRLPQLDRSDTNPLETLRIEGANIGLIGAIGTNDLAVLFSVSEAYANPLLWASTTARCDRPNIPAGTKPNNWYHYYPPYASPNPRPHPCVGPACSGTVR